MVIDERRTILGEIGSLLEAAHEGLATPTLRAALSDFPETFEGFLISNELWGGAGSIADQSLASDENRRRLLERLLITLGKLQLATGKVNPRTAMWVKAFEDWNS